MNKNVTIIIEPTGKRFVLINDLRFKGKTKEGILKKITKYS